MSELRTVEWVNGRVRMIDQTRLPYKFAYVSLKDYRQVAKAIKDMVVRGAPAIGVAAAMGIALVAYSSRAKSKEQLIKELEGAADVLRQSRPTAWNLFWAIDRILNKAHEATGGASDMAARVVDEAQRMAEEDVTANRKIGEYGAALIDDGDSVLTHCNTGTLATVSYGTALAPIRTAVSQGKKIRVFATETRPRLQGAKLTTYELLRDKIPVTLIVDGAVGYVMRKGLVDKAIVGADRITTKFVANKVGTYQVALAAQANQVPFYVAAPSSTFDLRSGDAEVKIEERSPQEVTHIRGKRIVPKGVEVFNPAFDVTPVEMVMGFITEKGVVTSDRLQPGFFSS
jgi:methylthioribose-1-phosphate isomerase